MQTAERRRLYYKQYYQQHKDKYNKDWRKYYERRKALGIEVGDQDIYHTITELKEAEERGEGIINWEAWDRIAEQTKQDITNALKDYKTPSKRKPIYCYSMTSKIPLIVFKNSDEAATTLGVNRMIITNHARLLTPLYDKGIILSYQPI